MAQEKLYYYGAVSGTDLAGSLGTGAFANYYSKFGHRRQTDRPGCVLLLNCSLTFEVDRPSSSARSVALGGWFLRQDGDRYPVV